MITALAVFEKEPDAVVTTVGSMEKDFEDGVFGFFVAEAEETGGCSGFALYHWRYSTWWECFGSLFVVCLLPRNRTGRCLFLEDLYVDESARGAGLGKELFMAVVNLAAKENVARLQWQVLSWNTAAIEFYKNFDAEVTSDWLNCKLVREQLCALAAKAQKVD